MYVGFIGRTQVRLYVTGLRDFRRSKRCFTTAFYEILDCKISSRLVAASLIVLKMFADTSLAKPGV